MTVLESKELIPLILGLFSNSYCLQNRFIYIARAVTFSGGKGEWRMYPQTIHPAASNMLSFNSGIFVLSSYFLSISFENHLMKCFFFIRQVEKEQPDGTLTKQVRYG